MPDSTSLEFTGERVVPGLVDADLLNEHLARYRFAERFAAGSRVLDAGCGSGYGTAEFQRAQSVVGVDLSAEAADYARRNFSRPGVHFLESRCEALPFADAAFDLVVAFEVIEHLVEWQQLLSEARRVLQPAGVLLVSTPNKSYYAEARGAAGPNPYHVREFEYREFETALQNVFPHVRLWTQNHSEAIVFLPSGSSPGDFDAPGDAAPEHAHFFLAACSRSPIPPPRAFAWSPASGNLLREREHHIALLESDLRRTLANKASLHENHERLRVELEQHNEWANKLNAELNAAGTAIARLQGEIKAAHAGYGERVRQLEEELAVTHAGYQEHVRQLEAEAAVRLDWVHDLEAQIGGGRAEIERLERENSERDAELQRANAALTRLDTQLQMVWRSKWVRLGQMVHLGPGVTGRAE